MLSLKENKMKNAFYISCNVRGGINTDDDYSFRRPIRFLEESAGYNRYSFYLVDETLETTITFFSGMLGSLHCWRGYRFKSVSSLIIGTIRKLIFLREFSDEEQLTNTGYFLQNFFLQFSGLTKTLNYNPKKDDYQKRTSFMTKKCQDFLEDYISNNKLFVEELKETTVFLNTLEDPRCDKKIVLEKPYLSSKAFGFLNILFGNGLVGQIPVDCTSTGNDDWDVRLQVEFKNVQEAPKHINRSSWLNKNIIEKKIKEFESDWEQEKKT